MKRSEKYSSGENRRISSGQSSAKLSDIVLIIVLLNVCGPAAADAAFAEDVHTIFAAGDIMLSGSGEPVLKKKTYDYAFSDPVLSRLIKGSDVAFANLECPVAKRGEAYKGKKFVFKADPASIRAVKKAGFDMLSLANNHILDYGDEGLSSTIRYCRKHGLACSGAGGDVFHAREPAILKRKGVTYALLSYSMTFPEEFWASENRAGTAYGKREEVILDIRSARNQADIVMVSFHWGEELSGTPKEYQIAMAHAAIDAGADMVLGHHPHVPQPIEIYRGKPVFYSLGNYAFGSFSRKTPISFAARIYMKKNTISSVRIYPVKVDNYEVRFRPAIARGNRAKEIIDAVSGISLPFGTKIAFRNGTGIIEVDQGVH